MADEDPIEEEDPTEEIVSPLIDSILITTKRLLGIEADYIQFDPDIVVAINSAFTNLQQIGVVPETGFSITGDSEVWTDFLGDRTDIELVKTYIYLKTRMVFDPPQTGYLLDAIKSQILEIEWRLNT